MTALTVYGTNVAASTLATAGKLVTTAGGTLASCSSKIGTSTGYGEIYALSNANAWPSLGSIPNPAGTAGGFLLDANTLDGKTIAAGTWTPEIRVRLSSGTVASCDFYMPVWKYTSSSGVFTFLWQPSSLSNALTTAFSFPTFNNPSEAVVSFNPGDFLYYEVWANLNNNSSGSGAATLIMTVCSDTGNADNSLITPGYSATSTTSLHIPALQWWWPMSAGGGGGTPPPPSKLTMGWVYPGDAGAQGAYSTITPLNILKPQYHHLDGTGALIEDDDGVPGTVGTGITSGVNAGVNGYKASNLTSIKQYSTQQFDTISATWGSGGSASALMASGSAQTTFINNIVSFLQTTTMTGIELDWENLTVAGDTAGRYTNFLTFVTNLGTSLHTNGFKLMIDGPALDGASGTNNPQSAYRFKYEDFNSLPVDYLCPLIYDNEFNTNGAGDPQASTTYITNCCNWCLGKVTDYTKIVAGLSAKGYYGTTGGYSLTDNQTLTQMQALTGYSGRSRDSGSQEMMWASGGVSYDFNDTTTMDSHRTTVYSTGILHVSVWYVGSGVWF